MTINKRAGRSIKKNKNEVQERAQVNTQKSVPERAKADDG